MSLYNIITHVKDKRRNVSKAKLIGDFLNQTETIVDIGTGSGGLAKYLTQHHFEVTAVDIIDKTVHRDINPIIYDGLHLPFENESFDTSMLITILHHCSNPEQVFGEAVRVSKKKIIVLEDVYSSWLMKHLTWFMDSLVNMEFKSHPHSNKSEAQWEDLFHEHNLKVRKKTKTKVLAIFTQVMYHLEKQ
ncbi:class I SAM-dependent methyltransferase [Psychroflexus sp. CAK57W]|uniref:class I SAM-dependent methyltransferase n=1 Tax=Psychroflexus curvus TaxID=2873595 RepID=UPI001CCE1996|nr:class I SAM-dependent methyltransferase [Psychroflexus curvus]MBZ9626869.1 class I SAM-dependent methyltransferase [Psychroflexus curvus]MBZ9786643.1 class I SAM-dependent methyltransferase [Psychroflexus curvus]